MDERLERKVIRSTAHEATYGLGLCDMSKLFSPQTVADLEERMATLRALRNAAEENAAQIVF